MESLYYSKAIQQSWENLSIECWTVVPQMEKFLDGEYGIYDSWDAKIDCYRDLIENPRKVELIQEMWEELNVPKLYGIIEVDEKMK